MARLPLPFPMGGRNDDRAFTDQPLKTTRQAVNVRGYSPASGRMQGGQRSGLSAYLGSGNQPLNASNVPVQALASVSYAAFTNTYATLGNPAGGSSPNGATVEEWTKTLPLKDSALDVQLDVQQNAFVLSSSGTVVKFNADGTKVYEFTVPLQAGEAVGKRIALDGDSGIYVAVGGSSGARIFRYLETEDGDGVELQWIHATEGTSSAAMMVYAGSLFIALNDENADKPSRVVQLDGLVGSTPFEVLSRDLPKPVNALEFSRGGLIFACPPNADRGPRDAGGGVDVGAVNWGPSDLTNSEERIHAHLSAFGLGGFAPGQEVTGWEDIREAEQSAARANNPSLPAIIDTTLRGLYRPGFYLNNGVNTYGASGPRYTASALGPYPGLRWNHSENLPHDISGANVIWYDNGNGLSSQGVLSGVDYRADKVSASLGTLPGSTGVWPNTHTHNFAVSFLVRVPHSNREVLWSTGSYKEPGDVPQQGWLALTVNGDTTGSFHGSVPASNTIPGVLPGGISIYGPNDVGILSANAHGTAATQSTTDPELNVYLITLAVHGDGVSSSGDRLQLRVQGANAGAAVTLNQDLISKSRELLGHRGFDPTRPELIYRNFLEGFYSFSGDVLEVLTCFADSSADSSPHDVDMGTVTSGEFLDDIESMEGYIAHKWGVNEHVLTSGHTYRTSIPTGSAGTLYDALNPDTATSTSAAMASKDGILGKLDVASGSALWAIEGAGIGYGLAVDPENDAIYSVGPRLVPSGLAAEVGPRATTVRRMLDAGLTVTAHLAARGRISISALPADTNTFTLNDGVNGDCVFEFGPSLTTGDVLIDNTTGSPNASTLGSRISAAVTTAGSGVCDIYAEWPTTQTEYPIQVNFWNRQEGDNAARTITKSGANITVDFGLTAGTPEDNDSWSLAEVEDQSPINEYMRCAVDFQGDLYVPRAQETKSNHIVKYAKKAGTTTFTHIITGSAEVFDANAVALVREESDFGTGITSPEFMWIAHSNIESGSVVPTRETVRKVRLVSATPINVAPRSVVYRGIAGGNLYGFTKGGTAELLDTGTVDSDSIWVDTARLGGELFIVDNGTYKVHNPKKALPAERTKAWVSDSAGEIPKGCKLVASYRGRILLAGGDDPYVVHASKLGDPYNWDLFPREGNSADRAWSATSIATARNADRINAIAPWFDTSVLLGGDHSITQITGDPAAGGRIDLFTDATGMAWGQSHALSSDGTLYFMGSRGGIWMMRPPTDGRAAPPVEITERNVNRELTEIDFSATKVRLLWHEDEDALQVILARNTAATASVLTEHWWFESRTGAWWKDKFSDVSRVPQTLAVFDGDEADDRLVCFGCEDGRLRWWDRDALSDDGFVIESEVVIGPIIHQSEEFEQKVTGIEATLAGEFGGCRWALYAADDPEYLGDPIAEGDFKSGFSGKIRARARGGTLWFKLWNGAANQNWALESLFLDVFRAGRRRVRG